MKFDAEKALMFMMKLLFSFMVLSGIYFLWCLLLAHALSLLVLLVSIAFMLLLTLLVFCILYVLWNTL